MRHVTFLLVLLTGSATLTAVDIAQDVNVLGSYQGIAILNLSSVPLTVSRINDAGVFQMRSYPGWEQIATPRDAKKYTLNTGSSIVTDKQHVNVFHKNRNTVVDGVGWWVFSDTGVYRTSTN